mgnify:CR=1 FL=1
MTDQPYGLQAIADRYRVSLDAVRHLVQALEAGHGRMAQFNHPELGGFGQWSGAGMTMIGDMFNAELKARVDALCTALAAALRRVLAVVTAFTVGHSLTLIASALGWVSVPGQPVEVLIAASVGVARPA